MLLRVLAFASHHNFGLAITGALAAFQELAVACQLVLPLPHCIDEHKASRALAAVPVVHLPVNCLLCILVSLGGTTLPLA